ncbi:hypothetical protein SUGI_0803690 [Cryptomeria japonica]|uniref:protein NRT1/ PTR FAMILY 4.5 n=1 Tax=Cryptomeria japonica TaxID=3369 RepID=UPI002414878B|nr:protein NRT1/ PTR FAMILY 4.5 [Cryptomeria japonica]GLJ39356.1 hypothetical protein SUGI_0803690 [Cryptomeria japonica]
MGKHNESEDFELERFADWKGRPLSKDHHGEIAALFIYATQFFDSVAFLPIIVNLVTYFNEVMHLEIADSATTLTNFVGTTFLVALFGGLISDSYVDRFKMSFFSACTELAGYIILLVQAHYDSLKPPTCNSFDPSSRCAKVSGAKAVMLFAGLYLIAAGNGCLKGALLPFGADQFNEIDPKERRKISTYFNTYFFSNNVGAAIGVTVVVWVMNNKGWDIGFGCCVAMVFTATISFVTGATTYRNRIPGGSPLTRILQVFVAATYNRKLILPGNPNDLYEVTDKEANIHAQKLPNTKQFKFLDKAAIITDMSSNNEKMEPSKWRLCTVTQVEETKAIIRMLPIFGCTIILSTGLAQLQTFSVSQGLTMDRSMGKNFDIPAASLPFIPFVFLIVIIPIYDKIFVPFARNFTGHEAGITHLQRIGIGLVLSTISMTIAALVEVKRKNVAKENGMVDSIPLFMPPIPISVFWLGFQYFVFGIADLFTLVGTMEFFYSEAPEGMRSMATAFSYTSLSLGYFFSSILVNIVNATTRNITESRGWLHGNNLNRNHLNLFYWLLAILNVLNFVNYLFWSSWYKYKPLVGKTGNK